MLEKINKIVLIPLLFLTLGIVVGGIFAGKVSTAEGNELGKYFGEIFSGTSSGAFLKNELVRSGLIWLAVAASGMFVPGSAINMLAVSRYGFLTGYTAACFYIVYGIKGAFVCFSLLPEMLVCLPALIIFSAFSLKMSVLGYVKRKNFIKYYFFVCFVSLMAFCVVSLIKTYVSPVFLRYAFDVASGV